jgi:DeoR family transcriptional regulator of aga operon
MTDRTPASQGVRSAVPAGRRQAVLQLLQERGNVSVAELEARFGVSAMTARRDLRELEKLGLALRAYGGAVLPAQAGIEGSFDQRLSEFVDAKGRLADAALGVVQDGETVFVDSTTAAFYAVRRIIAAERRVVIVTNSLAVMELVGKAATVDLIALGGRYQPVGRCFLGPEAVRAARAVLADKALISVRGLTSDGWLSDIDPDECEVKRTMIEHARESILLISVAAMHRRGTSVITSLENISRVITADFSDDEAAQLRALAPGLQQV